MKTLFNLYYINFDKAYEIKTMLSNVIQLTKEVTNTKEENKSKDISANLSGKLGLNIFKLFEGQVTNNNNFKNSKNSSNKLIETFEVKITKSVILTEILENCKNINNYIKEGDLIKIDGVKLSVKDEEEHRMVKLIKSDIFKGLQIPETNGLDISNILNSVLSDYSYKIIGKSKKRKFIFKIPISFDNEFENNYSIDDLFIGKVTLVGIYKGKIEIKELKNTFQYLSEKENITLSNKIISSSYINKINNNVNSEKYDYIDILAILQNINTELGEDIE